MKNKKKEESDIELREKRIYADMPVIKAVLTMIIPTIISQVITVIYNLADTWYVGLTNNAAAVAAVSLCLPIYNILTAIANLFGIGGASVITRAIGKKDVNKAKNSFALSIWLAVIISLIYCLVICLIARPLLLSIGGEDDSIDYAMIYTIITIVIGGMPTVLSAVFAHLIRSTGQAKVASFGIMIGAILNMVLDPLFMFVLLPSGNEVMGAAIATTISNIVSLIFFIIYILRHKEVSIFSFKVEKSKSLFSTSFDILKSGLPSFSLLAAGQVSNLILNGMIKELGSSAAVAGLGVVRKIDSLAYSVNQGITQGMLPIVAYCFSSKRFKRMKQVILFSASLTVVFSIICSICSYVFAPKLIEFFIKADETIRYGTDFLRILCIAVGIYPLLFVIIAVFQATGEGLKPFLLSLTHKGSFDILLYFVIRKLFGLKYILWAAPIMSLISVIIGIILIIRMFKKISLNQTKKQFI